MVAIAYFILSFVMAGGTVLINQTREIANVCYFISLF